MKKRVLSTMTAFAILVVLALASQACNETSQAAPPGERAVAAGDQTAAAKAGEAEQAGGKVAKVAKVTKVVFVGQKDCCQCTGDRIAASWAALEQAVQGRADVAVERIELDVEEARATELEQLGKLMVVPGLYFLSADGALVKLLQGEVKAAQVSELLK